MYIFLSKNISVAIRVRLRFCFETGCLQTNQPAHLIIRVVEGSKVSFVEHPTHQSEATFLVAVDFVTLNNPLILPLHHGLVIMQAKL